MTVDNIKKFYPGATGLVTIGAESLAQIMPEHDSTERAVGANLALRSQVNVTGQAIYFGQNAHILAPSGDVTVTAGNYLDGTFLYRGGQVYLDTGAAIDVFGSVVQAPISSNIIEVPLFGAQLADAPLQRISFLRGKVIRVDIRQPEPIPMAQPGSARRWRTSRAMSG